MKFESRANIQNICNFCDKRFEEPESHSARECLQTQIYGLENKVSFEINKMKEEIFSFL